VFAPFSEMTGALIGLILIAAMLHASWNAMLKGGSDRGWTMIIMQTTTLTVSAIALAFFPAPAPRAATKSCSCFTRLKDATTDG
jgi:hypothetical protein